MTLCWTSREGIGVVFYKQVFVPQDFLVGALTSREMGWKLEVRIMKYFRRLA